MEEEGGPQMLDYTRAFDTSISAVRKCPSDFGPALALVPHLLERPLLGRGVGDVFEVVIAAVDGREGPPFGSREHLLDSHLLDSSFSLGA
jgi:hypothetical protein